MSEEEEREEEEEDYSQEDLDAYWSEMEGLSEDFSDLDDLDFEEIQEMQAAIERVKEKEQTGVDIENVEELAEEVIKEDLDEREEYLEQKEALISDFSDMEELDLDELREIKEAIETVKHDDLEESSEGEEMPSLQPSQDISSDLEQRIQEELQKKKEQEAIEEEVVTPEKFLEYVKQKRDKIWYHALWYLIFEVEDHKASKEILYENLKEVTSKSPIDDIPYHQFVFGLGYILRLEINKKQVVRYMTGSNFKININVETLEDILQEAGPPISKRPVIEEKEKKQMFSDFLKDDFSDI